MKKIAVLLIIALIPISLSLLLGGCEKHKELKEQTRPKPSLPPIFDFYDVNGSKIHIELHNDTFDISDKPKVAILLFLTSWCPSCKAQIPELKEIQKRFGHKVRLYGFLLDQPKNPKDFKKREGIDFFLSTSYKENERFAKLLYERLHAPANMPIPLMVIVKNGKYFIHYIGATPLEILRIDIKKALGE